MSLITKQFTVIKGYQIASGQAKNSPFEHGTIAMQKKYLEAAGIDLSNMHLATINARFNCRSIKLSNWDFQLKNIKWASNFPAENFNLMACVIKTAKRNQPGWIYQPSIETKVAHHQPKNVLEIITQYITDLHYGQQLSLCVKSSNIKFEN